MIGNLVVGFIGYSFAALSVFIAFLMTAIGFSHQRATGLLFGLAFLAIAFGAVVATRWATGL